LTLLSNIGFLLIDNGREGWMFRCLLWTIAAAIRPKVLLITDNLCLRQQLLVLQRRKPRPRLMDADRRFWILACRWFSGWRTSLLIVKPETVLRWHRQGWGTYWRRRYAFVQ
jgi:putative transposase